MTKTTSPRRKARKAWFAPRQVYLRTGESSDYVELSTSLQVGVAFLFGLLALWLAGASYSAVHAAFDDKSNADIASKLASTEAELTAATEKVAKIETLEIELADARTAIAKAQQVDETAALTAELNQTKTQLEEIRHAFSEAKAEEATLQAKLEAKVSAGEKLDDQPAEEASSLHAQLEEAFSEIEGLEKARDEAEARVAALAAENEAKEQSDDRNETMLNAATEEIERLQEALVETKNVSEQQEAEHRKAIDRLTNILSQEKLAKENLEQRVGALSDELQRQDNDAVDISKLQATADAEQHAAAIVAELNEADLLATIERLEAQIDARTDADETESTETENASTGNADTDEAVDTLKAELALAESEIETILRNSLSDKSHRESDAAIAQTFAAAVPERDDSAEVKELERELSNAKSDIIKLRSDVRVAKERLAEQADARPVAEQQPDNSAKLEQQLASTRSRIQQLNKALADAKLREVAVDLALINVVPAPSPPAPR